MWFFRRISGDAAGASRHLSSAPPSRPVLAPDTHDQAQQPDPWGGPQGEPELYDDQIPTMKKARWRPLFQITAFLTMFSVALAGGWLALMMFYYTLKFPDPFAVRRDGKATVIRIVARDGSLLAERGTSHTYMPIQMLPKHVIDAVVATEDRRFFSHWGIDPLGMIRAMFANMRAGRFQQGGSTLTQQLAKNLFLSHERTLTRKLDELALAVWLEYRLSKKEILELYLNRVYFGAGAYGIEAAAQRFFGKSARAMNVAEAALIAGLLKAPSHYAPSVNPGAGRARGRSVLRKMFAAGFLSKKQLQDAMNQQVRFINKKSKKSHLSYQSAVDYILDRLPRLLDTDHSEIMVETTIDATLQRTAYKVLGKELKKRGPALNASQAALVVMDRDGGIRALVGSIDYQKSQFNRATKAKRQPGSTFKPFVYLAALEAGYKPETIAYDLPLSIKGWTPRNANGRYKGTVTIAEALAKSINTVAVRVALDVGPKNVASLAHRLGITASLRADPSLALGTSEVPLIELVSAYNVFANGGHKTDLHIIHRIRTSAGRVLYAHPAASDEQLISPENVGALNEMLQQALITGTGRRAALAKHPSAGKTGTSQDYRDAWFIGYTAHMTAGIWIGNDKGTPMRRVSGGGLPAKMWHTIMTKAHRDKTVLKLPFTKGMGPHLMSRRPAIRSKAKQVAQNTRKTKQRHRDPARTSLTLSFMKHGPSARVKIPVPPLPVQGPPRRSHPRKQISQSFVANLLAKPTNMAGARQTKRTRIKARRTVASRPQGFDIEDIKKRLRQIPPKPVAARTPTPQSPNNALAGGRMALGANLGDFIKSPAPMAPRP